MIEVEVNGVIHEFPEGTSREVMRNALAKRYPAPTRGASDIAGEGARTLGRAGRNIAGAITGAIDVGLLPIKTLASGAEVGLEAAGLEGSVPERIAERIRTNPGMRELTLQAIDQATGNVLQPRGAGEATVDFLSEAVVPTGGLMRVARGIEGAPQVAGPVRKTLSDLVTRQPTTQQAVAQQATQKAVRGFGSARGNQMRLSRGQKTQDVDVQEFEDLARAGVKGPTAQEAARSFDIGQQEDIAKAFDSLLDDASIDTLEDATQETMNIIKSKRAQLNRFVNRAYEQARGKSGGVSFDIGTVKDDFVDVTKSALDEAGLTPNKETLPVTNSLYRQMTKALGQKGAKAVRLDAMERWRSSVTQQAESLRGTAEGKALTMMRKQYDEFMMTAADKAVKEGDQAAIAAFKKARGLRARLGKLYETDKIVNRITRDGGDTIEKVTADIFGSANFNSKKNAANTVRAIKNASRGKQDDVQELLKQGVIGRLLASSRGDRIIPGTEVNAVSLNKLKTQLNRLLDGNESLVKEIFTQEDIGVLRGLQDDLRRATSTQPGATNPSQSGTRILRSIAQVGGMARFIPGADLAVELGRPVVNARSAGKAREVFASGEELLAQTAKNIARENKNASMGAILGGLTFTGVAQANE